MRCFLLFYNVCTVPSFFSLVEFASLKRLSGVPSFFVFGVVTLAFVVLTVVVFSVLVLALAFFSVAVWAKSVFEKTNTMHNKIYFFMTFKIFN